MIGPEELKYVNIYLKRDYGRDYCEILWERLLSRGQTMYFQKNWTESTRKEDVTF
jgi:hypothetical protein